MSDHDDLTAIKTDVKWIRESMEQGNIERKALSHRLGNVEKNQWYAMGGCAAIVALFEYLRGK